MKLEIGKRYTSKKYFQERGRNVEFYILMEEISGYQITGLICYTNSKYGQRSDAWVWDHATGMQLDARSHLPLTPYGFHIDCEYEGPGFGPEEGLVFPLTPAKPLPDSYLVNRFTKKAVI